VRNPLGAECRSPKKHAGPRSRGDLLSRYSHSLTNEVTMMELQAKLERVGLAQYATILYENGFEDWDTVLDITEEDLDSLGFKRGHRRVLQKEIANARDLNSSPPIDGSRQSSRSLNVHAVLNTQESFERPTKRRYRWHPRADPNAPKKPKTAYVNFADHLRSDPSIATLSFVDIAREVGKRWQALDPTIKQEWENRAAQVHSDYRCVLKNFNNTEFRQCRCTRTRWMHIVPPDSIKITRNTSRPSKKHQANQHDRRSNQDQRIRSQVLGARSRLDQIEVLLPRLTRQL
jgi:hypothetical protein